MNPESIPVTAQPIAWVTEDPKVNVIQFNADWFRKMLGPGVYLINNKTSMLYVGMASNLLSRISSPEHQAVIESLKDERVDQVMLIPARSREHAAAMENSYISEFQPKYNIAGKIKQIESLSNNVP